MTSHFSAPERTLPHILAAQAAAYGERRFLSVGDATRSFA